MEAEAIAQPAAGACSPKVLFDYPLLEPGTAAQALGLGGLGDTGCDTRSAGSPRSGNLQGLSSRRGNVRTPSASFLLQLTFGEGRDGLPRCHRSPHGSRRSGERAVWATLIEESDAAGQ